MPSIPDDCVFEGHWRLKNGLGRDLIVHFEKVSDGHQYLWNATVVDGFARNESNITDGLMDELPPTQQLSVSHHGASPCLCMDEETGKPLCRDDTAGPYTALVHGSVPELGDFWLGRVAPAPAPESMHWRSPPDHEGKHCPLANVDELYGQQSSAEGCRRLTAVRIDVEEAPLDEGGYMRLAEEHSVYIMKRYVTRVVRQLGWNMTDDLGGLAGFAPWYCGVRVCDGKKCYRPPPRQSLQKMMFELSDAKWVHQLGDHPKRMVALFVLQLHWLSLAMMLVLASCCFLLKTFDQIPCVGGH